MVKFSIFAPVYNEKGNLKRLYSQISKVMDSMGSWELILVNDGSKDGSLKEMIEIKDPKVRIIDLKRNYGQAIAMDAGFRACRGEYLISIDADLQNDPKDIPGMFKKMQSKNLDVITGWRHKRKDPLWMLVVTKGARLLRGLFASDGVHDSGCTLRIYKKEFIEDLELNGEMHRYIMALLKWKGAKIGEMKINHRARDCGVTKYNWRKSFKGLVDLIYIWFWKKFSGRPLHLFGITGMFVFGFGVLSGFWSVYLKVFNGTSLSDSGWLILSVFFLMTGLQLFIAGITFDLLIRTYYNTSNVESRYAVKKEYKGGK